MAMSGGNYAEHFAGIQANANNKNFGSLDAAVAEVRKLGQFGFWKVLDEVAGPDDDIPMPKRSKYLDYEGEAAIVISKPGKNIRAADIREYVWGVTLFNDWTLRDPQTSRTLQYNVNKNFDGAASIGPCIVVGEIDFGNVDVETRVNGKRVQRFNTRDMIFSFGDIVEHLSRDFTFVPGDIISGGTGAGTAGDMTPRPPEGATRSLDLFIKPGDVVEVSSPQIGAIRNRVVAA
jgi:2-keto-4-pentenoate hydratase/2-oxohepta-3-ene-1,7-dioic acid hydratase in catechol pathway